MYPAWANTDARRALVDFGFPSEDLATKVDYAVTHSKPDRWLGNTMKEKKVKRAIRSVLPGDFKRLDELFDLVKAQNEYR
jgi:type I restriction enzyme R subunit